ncbi:MAG: hypothetical protein RJA44_2123, partial [Pseudomonadota bacterium]
GLSFNHKDWELACDNTRTCRAAGYSEDGAELPVSVLLTRAAGAATPVKAEVMVGAMDEAAERRKPAGNRLTLRIGGREFGPVTLAPDTLSGRLNPAQTEALLTALAGNARIEWLAGTQIRSLSSQGAAAVLLKFDEAQGRLGTTGALLRKGPRDEAQVPPPQSKPVLQAAATPRNAKPVQWPAEQLTVLRQGLAGTLKAADDCSGLTSAAIELQPLGGEHLLVALECWSAAYNSGIGYWVVNARPPYAPVLVTTAGSSYADGRIDAMQQGRGLGDCASLDNWLWTGRQFVHSAAASTGLCRMIAAGGAWELPTLVTESRPARP